MNKTKKLCKTVAKELSKNPVQRDYMKQILKLYFNQADDLEDLANLHAALYKVAHWIKGNLERDPGYSLQEVERRLTEALNDWEPEEIRHNPLDPPENSDKGEYTFKRPGEPERPPVQVSMVIMSHLSDIQEAALHPEDIMDRINFTKWLIMRYPDTNVQVNADKEWELYKERNK